MILQRYIIILSHYDIISPSFAKQDGGLHITTLSTLKANLLRTRRDIEKRLMALFPILSDLTSEINIFFW